MTLPALILFTIKINWTVPMDYLHVSWTATVMFWLGFLQAVFFGVNAVLFRRPGRDWNKRVLPPVSVLIPARDEEHSIRAAVEAVLASRGVELELIVLDDGSTDRTAEIVQEIAEKDLRVRLETAPSLPEGWNGKQHACWVLASLATHDVFCFLDADVRLGPEAMYRMVSEINYVESGKPGKRDKPDKRDKRDKRDKAMVSGFPAQKTVTFWEQLLLPLVHFVLLGFLPLVGERMTGWSAFGVGCGQFMMVRREPYFATGGHSACPETIHDGLRLPKLFRRHGFSTSVFDLSQDAICRMYLSGGEVWRGLTKNATEGMASWVRLPVFTVLLLFVQVLPLPLAAWSFAHNYYFPSRVGVMALTLTYGVRFFGAWRYRESWLGAVLHPVGVLMLLVLQWFAFFRKLLGFKATWKQRECRVQ
jgi:cellulose synthase/poly-beta-1,6-N-acetylglucosamine synthase-like glycosyltransferase